MKTWERNLAVMNSTLTCTERMLVLALASYLPPEDDHAVVWPSAESLAARAGCSERTVRRLVRRGVADGWLSVDWQKGGTFHTRILWASIPTPDTMSDGADTMSGGADTVSGVPCPVNPGHHVRGERTPCPGGADTMSDEVVHEEVHEEVQSSCPPDKPADERGQVILLSEHAAGQMSKLDRLAGWMLEEGTHREGEQRQWAIHQQPDWTVKVTESQTRLSRLKRLVADEGEALVRLAWTWALTGPDPWWREHRKGAALLTSFLTRKNFRRMAEAATTWANAGRQGVKPPTAGNSMSPFSLVLRWVSSRGVRGCPKSPAEAERLMGGDWQRHQAALRALGEPGHPKATVQGWVTIARADHNAERARLARIYDTAFHAARSTA